MSETRECRTCGQCLPLDATHFYREAKGKSGYRLHCKVCHRAKVKLTVNRDAARKRSLDYYRTHREVCRERSRRWRASQRGKDLHKVSQRRFYERHREACIERTNRYYQDNIEKRREYCREYARQRRATDREACRAYQRAYYAKTKAAKLAAKIKGEIT